ncbi:Hypothetical protein CAP_7718 [Chondromyces apiculatus DSM 436]|uniref:Uncharacterized protein n=1 Tax=Chondromyces apiculatus DSM 436 TaxID=1192034 RepID=A0A017TEU7_9BACT|nr:Hypothetical protein CAP_7718 [Chondromyces apiculatus DSM 436]
MVGRIHVRHRREAQAFRRRPRCFGAPHRHLAPHRGVPDRHHRALCRPRCCLRAHRVRACLRRRPLDRPIRADLRACLRLTRLGPPRARLTRACLTRACLTRACLTRACLTRACLTCLGDGPLRAESLARVRRLRRAAAHHHQRAPAAPQPSRPPSSPVHRLAPLCRLRSGARRNDARPPDAPARAAQRS